MDNFEKKILKEVHKWEQESMTSNCPMVFISYAYDNDEHRLWVRSFRDRLRADGINAITDESLPTGYPLNLFMEQILASKQLAFVICVVSTQYVQKANSGVGGVGYEQAIMTRELTATVGDNKILPILRENPEGKTPSFLGTKKYLDFRNDDNFEDVCWDLERDIFEFPKMPPLGKRPNWEDFMNKRRILKFEDISLTACELIVAVLENSGAALKTANGICVVANERRAPFQSEIPKDERASDDDAIAELCDHGLLCRCYDKLYCATDKAEQNMEKLKLLDETRVFLYAPDLVKSFFHSMTSVDSYIRFTPLENDPLRMEVRTEQNLLAGKLVSRSNAESAVEYLYREKMLDGLWVVDENDLALIKYVIKAKLSLLSISAFFGDVCRVRLIGEISERGRRIASIDLRNLNQK